MDPYLKALIDAPLADPAKLYLPQGKRTAKRFKPEYHDDIGCPKLTGKQVRERKETEAKGKLASVLDYYATTEIPFAKIAELAGLYRIDQTGIDEDKKPILERVLDVERARKEMLCRGRSA